MDSDRNGPLINNTYPSILLFISDLPPQNQGYNPNYNTPPQNQGYSPNPPQNHGILSLISGFNNNMPPPNYGGQQPMMPGQQPMPNIAQGNFIHNSDKIIIIQQHSSMPCPMCGFDGASTWRQKTGVVSWAWCICLFLFFWPLCWLPFCMDSCYDTQIVCNRCGQVKNTIQATCC